MPPPRPTSPTTAASSAPAAPERLLRRAPPDPPWPLRLSRCSPALSAFTSAPPPLPRLHRCSYAFAYELQPHPPTLSLDPRPPKASPTGTASRRPFLPLPRGEELQAQSEPAFLSTIGQNNRGLQTL
ncbi:hypothetical protein U9M48_045017 [Paspalum notatum var. saurae]|uniref:Uncharacterized protein n=1 Tax=Paspalum notatum var. saurae TaxID=547442 RepID=A0AAQ3XK25_PASNO